MKKLLSVILFITMFLSSLPSAYADGKDRIKVGICADFKPFEYYNQDGTLAGFDVDLMNLVAERTGYEIEYVDMSFDQLFSSVINGDVDCAISAISFTEERDNVIDYSRPYLKTNNITFENGKQSSKYGEEYAIIFKEGLAGSPYKNLTNPTDDETLYILIDEALRELSNDKTVMKLIEKYELNKPLDENAVNVEYSAIMGDGTPFAGTDDFENMTSATSVPPSAWASDDIKKAQELNIISIGANYDFPEPITREEFCELVYDYMLSKNVTISGSVAGKFSDTKNEKVNLLASIHLVKGKTDKEFAPNDFLTREEAAVILGRLINIVHRDMVYTNRSFEFDDASLISAWAKDYVQIICRANIMEGVGNNCFAPQKNYTTEQAIATLVRMHKKSESEKKGMEIVDVNSDGASFSDKLNLLMPSDKNYMFSPLSIKMAFAMAANGADGNTQDEILKTLGIDNLSEYNEYVQKLIDEYQKADVLNLDVANALWLNKSNTKQNFSQSYKTTVKSYYNAEVNSSDKNVIADEINSWVRKKTNNKIDGIISNDLARDSRFIMALLNAVYFKAEWQNEFRQSATKKDTFTDRNGKDVQIDFMNRTGSYSYYIDDKTEVLKLPYKNTVYDEATGKMQSCEFDVSMYLVRGAYSEDTLSEIIEDDNLTATMINLAVPKFESEFETSLVDIMKKLGVKDAFSADKSNFTKMFDNGNVYLGDAIHKSYIKVNEKGTEAAAVTVAFGMATSALMQPQNVKFNTPFTYVIRDDANGEILFMGEYAFAE